MKSIIKQSPDDTLDDYLEINAVRPNVHVISRYNRGKKEVVMKLKKEYIRQRASNDVWILKNLSNQSGTVFFITFQDVVNKLQELYPHVPIIIDCFSQEYFCVDAEPFDDAELKTEPKMKTENEIKMKQFASGAKRSIDADNVAYHLLPPKALELAAMVFKQGETKYGKNNWKKGFPTDDILNHAIRHIFLFLQDDKSEPHLSHALCNLMFACHFEYENQKNITQNKNNNIHDRSTIVKINDTSAIVEV
ncbi:MAG: DUF5664 domain-containing protein [Planctomycetaceae bacterium]|jgi:hypothetical protein|nr:DUF5664 domain-containing protein [Planctomycetaceae bacterium]